MLAIRGHELDTDSYPNIIFIDQLFNEVFDRDTHARIYKRLEQLFNDRLVVVRHPKYDSKGDKQVSFKKGTRIIDGMSSESFREILNLEGRILAITLYSSGIFRSEVGRENIDRAYIRLNGISECTMANENIAKINEFITINSLQHVCLNW